MVSSESYFTNTRFWKSVFLFRTFIWPQHPVDGSSCCSRHVQTCLDIEIKHFNLMIFYLCSSSRALRHACLGRSSPRSSREHLRKGCFAKTWWNLILFPAIVSIVGGATVSPVYLVVGGARLWTTDAKNQSHKTSLAESCVLGRMVEEPIRDQPQVTCQTNVEGRS